MFTAFFSFDDDDLTEMGLDYGSMPVLAVEFESPSFDSAYKEALSYESRHRLDLVEFDEGKGLFEHGCVIHRRESFIETPRQLLRELVHDTGVASTE